MQAKRDKDQVGSNWMAAKGYKQVSLYFTTDQIDKIDRLAKVKRCKRSQLVLTMFLDALDKKK